MACETSHPGARQLADPALRRSFLLLSGTASSLSETWPSFLCRADDLGQVLLDFVAALVVGRALFFQIAQIDVGVQFFGFALDLFGDLDRAQLHQSGAADGLLHAQLAALHAAGQVDFALAGQQRNGAHFAQIHAYRVVGINRLFDRMGRRKLFAVMDFFGMEETRLPHRKEAPEARDLRLKIDLRNDPLHSPPPTG